MNDYQTTFTEHRLALEELAAYLKEQKS